MNGLSSETDKAAFLKRLAPLFPDVSDTEARLQALERDHPGQERWHERLFLAAEQIYFPLWQTLAPAYAAALATSVGVDDVLLVTSVEAWPDSLEQQQQSLFQLMERSQLRESWRNYAATFENDFLPTHDRSVVDAEKREFERAKVPLREIPLYQEMMRTSCQQLVCMPVRVWQSLFADGDSYEPQTVDAATVDRLATRVAHVFNTPPLDDVALLTGAMSWDDPVVWGTHPGGLTDSTNSHGMRDRWAGAYGRSEKPADSIAPQWRYEGFYGQIRVTLETGEDWFVTVLAPMHFVRRLGLYAEWFRRANQ